MEGDAALAVQPQEGVHGAVGGLPQQRQAHEQPARSPLLPPGRLVFLQRLVEPVLEAVHGVRTVQGVGVWDDSGGGVRVRAQENVSQL